MNPIPDFAETHRRWRAARNILLVRLDNFGDVLMTTPAIAAVRHGCPEARLTLLASKAGAVLRRHLPVLDEVLVYDAPWIKGAPGTRSVLADARMIETLVRRRFDAAIVFTVCTQSALPAALLCRLAGIPLRLAHCRENPYELLTHWVPDPDVCATGMRHEVARQLDLARAVGFHSLDERMLFRIADSDAQAMRRKAAEAGLDLRRGYIVVHPGASAASRRYPARRFGLAAAQIAEGSGCQIVFTGGSDEQGLTGEAQAAMAGRAVALAGRLSLGEFAALVAGARLIVCNNSGPAHIAAALGTPVVVLYALTNPQHTPWQVESRVLNHDVPCRHCLKSVCPEQHHACLLRVEPDAVARAALDLLANLPPLHLLPHRQRSAAPLTGFE